MKISLLWSSERCNSWVAQRPRAELLAHARPEEPAAL